MKLRYSLQRSIFVAIAVALFIGCDKSDSQTSSGSSSGANAPAAATATGTRQVHKAPEGPLKLAFVTNNASDFWKIAAAGVHKYETEANVKVDIRMPPTGTVEEQNNI